MIENTTLRKAIGWGLVVAAVSALGAVTMPNVGRIQSAQAAIAQQNDLIDRHLDVLARPPVVTPHTALQKHIVTSEEADMSGLAADFQAELLEALTANQARLINLRKADSVLDIGGLEGLDFRLTFEGDLQSIVGVADTLNDMQWPVLVETMELVAQGPETRPDRKVRASLSLRVWVEIAV
ncbi:MAG: hypothetical protein AAF292_14170 [Pseudomonadota bacterium]